VSLLQYVQSAQDEYISKRHRERITELRKQIQELAMLGDIPGLFAGLDDTDTGKKSGVFHSLTSWRWNVVRLTAIPPVFSLGSILFWLVAIGLWFLGF